VTATFDGTIQYDEYKDSYGKVASKEIVTGMWRISPKLKLNGSITTTLNPDGNYTVVDNRI
jgi:hypothetical protein